MSRIGKQPITLPEGVNVTIEEKSRYGGQKVVVAGPKGQLEMNLRPLVKVELADKVLNLSRKNDSKMAKSLHGLYRTLLNNQVLGVTEGFVKKLELIGVGYKAFMKGNDIEIKIGFNHPVLIKAPEGISFAIQEDTKITVSGIDKDLVGQIGAKIRQLRKADPYKGKGVYYAGERIRRKAGKSVKSE